MFTQDTFRKAIGAVLLTLSLSMSSGKPSIATRYKTTTISHIQDLAMHLRKCFPHLYRCSNFFITVGFVNLLLRMYHDLAVASRSKTSERGVRHPTRTIMQATLTVTIVLKALLSEMSIPHPECVCEIGGR
ncbi:hypothetical protein K456DRAFT_1080848 [Colletotrichum gloeosporioides 23]|nr:hypothetical protein K456DRAFT_1080848 [Colletotrichum gloeosporioides 23]